VYVAWGSNYVTNIFIFFENYFMTNKFKRKLGDVLSKCHH